MLALDTVTAERLREREASTARAAAEAASKLDLIAARLFGPVKFASGLPTEFLRGRL
jgi:hypothetical protein